ncbi:hypothetical protein B0T26DRAFT_641377 [Lasiosphaeria miniovina]|uniref:Ketoreductase domain-containing protein n=1 Tax=Lasiosphaeria miniovina TaxID=1954250 RepID=A0AA40AT80_9PEZI|nr:uncharacterized protein B0T26DRAFT_641377 [Lasiosphaeria miniovina]KAK0721585.1 hypothetical protein B0T26DRAFT_641377 [Lasiosphaeria miniovina]
MYENTVYLVTGANRGIGLAMVTMLLQRPHTTVIATSRRPPPQEHSASSATSIPDELPAHATSTLVQVLLNDSDATISSATLHGRLRDTHNIARLDVVVANAGSSSGFHDILATDPDFDLLHDFVVNAAGPAKLFRAVWPLLDPEFVLITSSLGSIGCLDEESMPSTAYGMSKAAANWFAKKLSVEFRDRGLLVGIIHPGFVKTSMGQAVADAIGMKEPPMSVEDSAKGVIEQIDTLTPEKSGQFLRFDGGKMPW